ncbi:MAG: stalk domain-containing protein [Ignavibacteriales bacterium]
MKRAMTMAMVSAALLVALCAGAFVCSAEAAPKTGVPQEKKHRFLEAADEIDSIDASQERLREQARTRKWERLEVRVRERLQAIQDVAGDDLDEAISEAEEYAEDNPAVPEASELVQDLKRLREKKIEHEQVKTMLRLAVTERETALEQLRQFLTEHPLSKEAFKAVAKIEEEQGRFKEAIEAIEQAAGAEPGDETVYAEMKRLYVASGDKSLKVFVNGKKPAFDQPPVIVSGRTLVPIRAIGEALGATVEWREQTREVVVSKGDIQITLQLENRVAIVNGQTVELDVPPKSTNGRTVIPIRFVSEALRCKVDYDGDSGLITVDEPDEDEPDEDEEEEELPEEKQDQEQTQQ